MSLAAHRDERTVASGLARWLVESGGRHQVTVADAGRPASGYSSDTVFVEASFTDGGTVRRQALVVRMPPVGEGTIRHYDLAAQVQAQTAAGAAGVPVTEATYEPDPGWLGAPFVVMPRIDGMTVGEMAGRDRWVRSMDEASRGRLVANFVSVLATVHGAEVASAPDVPRRDNPAELDHWEAYLDWACAGAPPATLVAGLEWCRRHLPPAESPPVLLWGDPRFGNVIFGEDLRPRAVLDWDMASVGAPEHDLAWCTSLDETAHRLLGGRPAGFPDRAGTVALFELRSGRPVRDLEWYETLAMVRSTAVLTRIGHLRQSAGEPLLLPIDDNPLLDLLRERLT